jgi:hypothetical protein
MTALGTTHLIHGKNWDRFYLSAISQDEAHAFSAENTEISRLIVFTINFLLQVHQSVLSSFEIASVCVRWDVVDLPAWFSAVRPKVQYLHNSVIWHSVYHMPENWVRG